MEPSKPGEIPRFEITKPDEKVPGRRMSKELSESDIQRATVQIIPPGISNQMHSHKGQDGFWLVLEGTLQFYAKGDETIDDLEARQGVLVPHDTRYWFENVGDEDVVLLHIASYTTEKQDRPDDDHVYYRPDQTSQGPVRYE